jgi:integrase
MASIYLRGKVYWGKFSQDGRVIRQSLGTQDKTEARRRLREREAQVVRGERPTTSKATWEDTAADLLAYYRAYGSRNPGEAGIRIRQLTKYWRGWKLGDIDSSAILSYVSHMKATGRANATINLDLATLRRALRLAHEHGKLEKIPLIRMLRPAAPRSGFFEREQFERVTRALPDDLALVARIGYTFGWRIHSEVLTATKAQVDLEAGTLRLAPGSTKNRDGRLVYLTTELKAGIADQLTRVKGMEREMGITTPWLFPNLHGRHRGEHRRDIRGSWVKACRLAGCPQMHPHDLRRTAARNMVNLGVPERVVMQVMGHRTRSMLDRYHIVSPGDLQDVARRLNQSSHSQAHSIGTSAGN